MSSNSRPPVATKPKKQLQSSTSQPSCNRPSSPHLAHKPAVSAKPKPKLPPPPLPPTNKRPALTQALSTDHYTNGSNGDSIDVSPGVSPATKRKLVSLVSSDVHAEISKQIVSNKSKLDHHAGLLGSSPTADESCHVSNNKRSSPIVLPKKVLARKPSPKEHSKSSPSIAQPVPKQTSVPVLPSKPTTTPSTVSTDIKQQWQSRQVEPLVSHQPDKSDDEETYECPNTHSIMMQQSQPVPTIANGTMVNGEGNYETPLTRHGGMTDDNMKRPPSADDPNSVYAYLSDTIVSGHKSGSSSPNQETNSPPGVPDEGETYFEVPVSVASTTADDDETYETPDIESIRIIQAAELKKQPPSTKGNCDNTAQSIPPPPGMLPPKLQKRKNKMLPAIPTTSTNATQKLKKTNSKNVDSSAGYTTHTVTSSTMENEGMIYEEVKPAQKPTVVSPPIKKPNEQQQQPEEYMDPSLVFQASIPEGPPLPPPRKPQQPQLVKVFSPLEAKGGITMETTATGGGLELTEDDENELDEDYVDMSGSIVVPTNSTNTTSTNYVAFNKCSSESNLLTNQEEQSSSSSVVESEGIYEEMDISRPIPPPRRRHRHTETVKGKNSHQQKTKLKASTSFDGILTTDSNYVTMHRQK